MKTGWICAGALSLAAFVAGCGGGGGGSGGNGGSTGLVPPAPAVGDTLLADATVLRPLAANRQWRYRGTEVPSRGAVPVLYSTTTTHSSVTATQATENYSNAANSGADSVTLQVAGGEVANVTVDLDLTGSGLPGTVRQIELRSPVRVNDQYISLDQRYTDTNVDFDNDGREDPIDIAAWTRVIGRETVLLADVAGTQVSAVRADTQVVARFVLASNGNVAGTVTATQSVWYAEGTGVVKQTITVSEDVNNTLYTATEVLAQVSQVAGAPAGPQAVPARSAVLQRVVDVLRAAAQR